MSKKGFTLIEMLVVVFIVALLATIVIVTVNRGRSDSRDAKRKGDLAAIKVAVEGFYDRNGNYNITYIENGTQYKVGGDATTKYDEYNPSISYSARGYFNRDNCVGGHYCRSIAEGLESWGLIDPVMREPLENDGYQGYMFWTDGKTKYAIYARLENWKDADGDGYDDSSSAGSSCISHGWPGCQSNYRIGNGG